MTEHELREMIRAAAPFPPIPYDLPPGRDEIGLIATLTIFPT